MDLINNLLSRYRVFASQRMIGTKGMPVTYYIHAGDTTYTMVVPPHMTNPVGKRLAADVVRRVVELVSATAVVQAAEVWVVTTKPGELDRYVGRSLADVEGREEKLLLRVETQTSSAHELCGIERHPTTGLVTDILAPPPDDGIESLQGDLAGYFDGPHMKGNATLSAAVDLLAQDTIANPTPAPSPVTH